MPVQYKVKNARRPCPTYTLTYGFIAWCVVKHRQLYFYVTIFWSAVKIRWHTRRNQISSFGETDESMWPGGGGQFSQLLAA
jgi:hypothetical protein